MCRHFTAKQAEWRPHYEQRAGVRPKDPKAESPSALDEFDSFQELLGSPFLAPDPHGSRRAPALPPATGGSPATDSTASASVQRCLFDGSKPFKPLPRLILPAEPFTSSSYAGSPLQGRNTAGGNTNRPQQGVQEWLELMEQSLSSSNGGPRAAHIAAPGAAPADGLPAPAFMLLGVLQ